MGLSELGDGTETEGIADRYRTTDVGVNGNGIGLSGRVKGKRSSWDEIVSQCGRLNGYLNL